MNENATPVNQKPDADRDLDRRLEEAALDGQAMKAVVVLSDLFLSGKPVGVYLKKFVATPDAAIVMLHAAIAMYAASRVGSEAGR